MATFSPVDFDPFASDQSESTGTKLIPVDHDPFAETTKSSAPVPASLSERIAGHPATRFAVGAASPILGSFQLGANVGDWIAEQIGLDPVVGKKMNELLAQYDEMKRKGMAEDQGVPVGEEGMDVAGLAGVIATPMGAYKQLVAKSLLPTTTEKVLEGMRLGGIFGATAPVISGEQNTLPEHGTNAALGMAVGGAVPLVIDTTKGTFGMLRDVVDLKAPGGAERIARRYMNRNLPQDRGQLISAMENPRQLVPGSIPTAAEASAHLPEGTVVSAQQKITATSPGEVSTKFARRTMDQNQARIDSINKIAGSSDDLSAAETSRRLNAEKNYAQAYRVASNVDSELATMFENPYLKQAYTATLDAQKASGLTPKKDLVEIMHLTKQALDRMLQGTPEKPLASYEQKLMGEAKAGLINWMDKKTGGLYAKARSEYAADSAPINRMVVGKALKDKLVSSVADVGDQEASIGLRNAGYPEALRNAHTLIKKATGYPLTDKLSDVPGISIDDMQLMENIAKDLARKQASLNPAQVTSLPGGLSVASETVDRLPSMLSTPVVIINNLIKRMTGTKGIGVEKAVDEVMAKWFMEPKVFAEALKRMTPSARTIAARRYAQIARNPALIGLGQYGIAAKNQPEEQSQ